MGAKAAPDHKERRRKSSCRSGSSRVSSVRYVAARKANSPSANTPQDSANGVSQPAMKHQSHRNVERGHHGCETSGESGEEKNDDENEPYVVGFPNWRDGISDRLTLPLGTRPERQEVPYPSAKIRAAHERIDDERR